MRSTQVSAAPRVCRRFISPAYVQQLRARSILGDRNIHSAIQRRASRLAPRRNVNCTAPSHARKWVSAAASEEFAVVDLLNERGLINQVTGDFSTLNAVLGQPKRPGAYVGVDPTASSVHVGHIVPFMALFWLAIYGHRGIMLVGGATGQIGDPSGRLMSRDRLYDTQREKNVHSIEQQLHRIWRNVQHLAQEHVLDTDKGRLTAKIQVENNLSWMQSVGMLDFLRTIGHSLRIGPMLSRDSVKLKMEKGDGMSYAEFTYPILQAWDWWHMYSSADTTSQVNIQLQIGGADQFGNILTGMESIKSILKDQKPASDHKDSLSQPIGFTVPLLTTASGEKFGKSAGNALWLDAEQTRPFDLYGYFVGAADADVERLLKLFTFLSIDRIGEVMTRHKLKPEARGAQHLLAREVLRLAHGDEVAQDVAAQHAALHHSDGTSFQWAPEDADFTMNVQDVAGKQVKVLLAELGLESRASASRLLKSGGVYVALVSSGGALNWRKLGAEGKLSAEATGFMTVPEEWISPDGMLMFRFGKSRMVSIHVVRT